MHIILKDDVPINQSPRRLLAEQRNMVNKIIDEWIRNGIVRPSNSEYVNPVILVSKTENIDCV